MRYQIWYFDTRNAAGFADIYIWDSRKCRAYMFEARDSKRVFRDQKCESFIFLASMGFVHLDDCTLDEMKIKFPNFYEGIRNYRDPRKNRKTYGY